MTTRLLIALFVALAIYGGIEAWPLIAGPSISISTPADYATLPQDGIVTIRGNAARTDKLTLDGAPVDHEENGDFSITLTLPRGGSILTMTAADRFGRQVSTNRSVFVP